MLPLVTPPKTLQNQFQEAKGQHTQVFPSKNPPHYSQSNISEVFWKS
ncbi:MAG: hypothetical protein AB7I49_07460 [Candidatus Nitrosocosmicus sp.]|jgi:hypothetical protein